MNDRLLIFARTPELGRVKRRLAADIGEAGALAAHEELLERVIRLTAGTGDYRVALWLTRTSGRLPVWLESLELHEQSEGDLGQRMQQAMSESLADGGASVLVGSDCPGIDAGYVAAAFTALKSADVVFGPAEDGGYGLVGMTRLVPEIFAELRWGDDGVLHRALERAAQVGASVELLTEIYDVDTLADWQRYQQELGS